MPFSSFPNTNTLIHIQWNPEVTSQLKNEQAKQDSKRAKIVCTNALSICSLNQLLCRIINLNRLRKVQRSFVGLAVRFHNKVPKSTINLPIQIFKKHAKTRLKEKGYYTVDEYINDKEAWK